MKKKIAILLIVLCMAGGMVMGVPAQADESFEPDTAVVLVDELNLRTGCSTDYNVVELLYKDMEVQVLGEMDGWLMVYVPDTGMVGAVDASYVSREVTTATDKQELVPDQEVNKLLTMINSVRNQAGLPDLSLDDNLNKIAGLKARDMADNNYFGHNSEVYGNPFEMMTAYGIKFGAAGENIAGNKSIENAFASWTDSEEHIRNIIGENYAKVGIGIVSDETYGKIIVLEFTD
ncbi:MAG: hypothetical protein IKV30_00050 [Clostridia bacterium]|nr:hypothetical protein [Clostridia bacterium]